ncbi:MAG: hypothetical protein AAFP86_13085, partial [Planctomycetota bacterium]
MSEFEVVSYTVEPVEGDDQIAITIHASDGNKWEYGVPYSPSTGRYTFEELDVLAVGTDGFASVVAVDLDGDGVEGVLVTEPDPGTVTWLE